MLYTIKHTLLTLLPFQVHTFQLQHNFLPFCTEIAPKQPPKVLIGRAFGAGRASAVEWESSTFLGLFTHFAREKRMLLDEIVTMFRTLSPGYAFMPFAIYFILNSINALASRQTAYKTYVSPSATEDLCLALNYAIMLINSAVLVAYRFFGLLACTLHPDASTWYKSTLTLSLSCCQMKDMMWAYVAPWTVVPDTSLWHMVYVFIGLFVLEQILSRVHWANQLSTSTMKWAKGAKVLKLRDTGVRFASIKSRFIAKAVDTALVGIILLAMLTLTAMSDHPFMTDIFSALPAHNVEQALHGKMVKVAVFVAMSSGAYTMVTGARTVGRHVAGVRLVGPDGSPIGRNLFVHAQRVLVSVLLTPSLVDLVIAAVGADEASIVDALTGTRLLEADETNVATLPKDMKVFSPKKKAPVPKASASPVASPVKSPKKATPKKTAATTPKVKTTPKRKQPTAETEDRDEKERETPVAATRASRTRKTPTVKTSAKKGSAAKPKAAKAASKSSKKTPVKKDKSPKAAKTASPAPAVNKKRAAVATTAASSRPKRSRR